LQCLLDLGLEKITALMELFPHQALPWPRTLRQAAERAIRGKLESRLSLRTLRSFFLRISAVLNFGVQEGQITRIPPSPARFAGRSEKAGAVETAALRIIVFREFH